VGPGGLAGHRPRVAAGHSKEKGEEVMCGWFGGVGGGRR